MKRALFCLVLAVCLGWAAGASAYLFTAQEGLTLDSGRAASVDFSLSQDGKDLLIILTNTSTADVLNPTQVLTGVFFTLAGDLTLTPLSATLNGSTVLFGSSGGGNVGGEWAYGAGLSGAPLGAEQGISSTGLGLFGGANFNGADLDPPAALDGLNYGLTSAGDNPATGNKPVTGKDPLIQNSVLFTLALPDGAPLTLGQLLGANFGETISFQYGTALSEPNLRVPEPATLLLLGAGLAGVGILGRRRSPRG